jgi:hypothetical protein
MEAIKLMYALCSPACLPMVMTEMASPETDVLRNMATVTNFSQNLIPLFT